MKQKHVVVIVAGGLATRMRPITEEIPKCLIDTGGKPLIQHQIEFFRDRGFRSFIFCVAHLADMVKEYFRDGSGFGVRIKYSQEPKELLGTAGAVKLIEPMVNETFIVYYGDNLTTEDFDKVLDFHKNKKSDFTILVRDLPEGYVSSSIINMDESGRIKTFLEKPPKEEFEKHKGQKNYINNGIYVVEPRVLGGIPENTKYDFAKDLIPKLMSSGFGVYGYVSNNFFREIGRVEKYEQFKKEVSEKGKVM
jgi:mannose-1-phosphate guanylyltransferase/phosphomannomutase